MKNLQMSEEAFANEDTFGNVRYKVPLLSCPALYDFSPLFLLSLLYVSSRMPGMGQQWCHRKPRKAYCFLTLKLKNTDRLFSSMQIIGM